MKALYCKYWLAGVIILLSPLVFASLWAQLGGGAIFGIVTDETDAVIPGAEVKATNVGTNKVNVTITGDAGFYEFPLLPTGTYVLSVEVPGFRTGTSTQVVLESGTRPRVDFQMQVGDVSERVEVVGSAPIINRSNPELGIALDDRTTKELPLKKRSFFDLLNLQPGVIARASEPVSAAGTGPLIGGRGGVEFYGSIGHGNNWLLDGIDMSFGENNATGDSGAGTGGAGALINTVSVEAISELKTTGSSFSAEYGRSLGAVININTKSGSNDFHGTAFWFWRRDRFNANSFFNNSRGLPVPGLKQDQYGGNIGGPVVKDRVFFFFNYEGADMDRETTQTGNRLTDQVIQNQLGIDSSTVVDPELGRIRHATPNPLLQDLYRQLSPAGCSPTSDPRVCFHARNAPNTNDENTYLWRGDVELTDTQHLSGRFSYNNQDFQQVSFTDFPDHTRIFPTRFRNVALQHNYTLSPRVLNEFRFGINSNALQRLRRALRGEFPAGSGSARASGLTAVDRQCVIAFDTKTWTIADNFSWIRDRHHLKFGFEARYIDTKRLIAENPIINYASVDDLLFERDPQSVQIWFGFPDGLDGFDTWQTGWYVNDDWRVTDRVQLNLGLRYEYYTPLLGPWNIAGDDPFGPFISDRETEAIFDTDRNNFAPRLGAVIDLDEDGKTVLRLGGAVSFIPAQPFNYFDMGFLPSPAFPSFARFAPVDIPDAFKPIRFPFTFDFQQQVIAALKADDPTQIPAVLREAAEARDLAERDRADAYASHWNLSLERELMPWLSASAAYVGSASNKLFRNTNPNLFDHTIRCAERSGPQCVGPRQRFRPEFSGFRLRHTNARINYHAMHLSLRARRSDLSFLTSYMWSRAMSYGSADTRGGGLEQDLDNVAGSYGPKGSDAHHRFMGNIIWEIPSGSHSGFARQALGGWNVSGIIGARSAYPFNILSGFDTRGIGSSGRQRPNRVPGVNPRLSGADRLAWVNPAAFCFPAAGGGCQESFVNEAGVTINPPFTNGEFGQLGLYTERGPAAFWFDMGLFKNFYLKEQHHLQFRFEMFNALNHPVLANPAGFTGASLTSATFGRINGGADGRSMQFGLKYIF